MWPAIEAMGRHPLKVSVSGGHEGMGCTEKEHKAGGEGEAIARWKQQ